MIRLALPLAFLITFLIAISPAQSENVEPAQNEHVQNARAAYQQRVASAKERYEKELENAKEQYVKTLEIAQRRAEAAKNAPMARAIEQHLQEIKNGSTPDEDVEFFGIPIEQVDEPQIDNKDKELKPEQGLIDSFTTALEMMPDKAKPAGDGDWTANARGWASEWNHDGERHRQVDGKIYEVEVFFQSLSLPQSVSFPPNDGRGQVVEDGALLPHPPEPDHDRYERDEEDPQAPSELRRPVQA